MDGILNRNLKLAVKTRPDLFAITFEACIKEAIFPPQWKKGKLVLLFKPTVGYSGENDGESHL